MRRRCAAGDARRLYRPAASPEEPLGPVVHALHHALPLPQLLPGALQRLLRVLYRLPLALQLREHGLPRRLRGCERVVCARECRSVRVGGGGAQALDTHAHPDANARGRVRLCATGTRRSRTKRWPAPIRSRAGWRFRLQRPRSSRAPTSASASCCLPRCSRSDVCCSRSVAATARSRCCPDAVMPPLGPGLNPCDAGKERGAGRAQLSHPTATGGQCTQSPGSGTRAVRSDDFAGRGADRDGLRQAAARRAPLGWKPAASQSAKAPAQARPAHQLGAHAACSRAC